MLSIILGIVTVACLLYGLYRMVAVRLEMKRANEAAQASVGYAILRQPDYDGLQRLFDVPIPDDLRWLYDQVDIIERRSMAVRSTIEPAEVYCIDRFLPASEETVKSTWFDIGHGLFPFAIDIAGNYFAVPVSHGRAPEVIYIDHEQTASWTIAPTLRDLFGGE